MCLDFCDLCVDSGIDFTITEEMLLNDVNSGMSKSKVAYKYGVTSETINRWLNTISKEN